MNAEKEEKSGNSLTHPANNIVWTAKFDKQMMCIKKLWFPHDQWQNSRIAIIIISNIISSIRWLNRHFIQKRQDTMLDTKNQWTSLSMKHGTCHDTFKWVKEKKRVRQSHRSHRCRFVNFSFGWSYRKGRWWWWWRWRMQWRWRWRRWRRWRWHKRRQQMLILGIQKRAHCMCGNKLSTVLDKKNADALVLNRSDRNIRTKQIDARMVRQVNIVCGKCFRVAHFSGAKANNMKCHIIQRWNACEGRWIANAVRRCHTAGQSRRKNHVLVVRCEQAKIFAKQLYTKRQLCFILKTKKIIKAKVTNGFRLVRLFRLLLVKAILMKEIRLDSMLVLGKTNQILVQS